MPGVGFEPTPPPGDQNTQILPLLLLLNQPMTLSLAPLTHGHPGTYKTASLSQIAPKNTAHV